MNKAIDKKNRKKVSSSAFVVKEEKGKVEEKECFDIKQVRVYEKRREKGEVNTQERE